MKALPKPKPELLALPHSPPLHWKPSLDSYKFSFFAPIRKSFKADFVISDLDVVFGDANEIRTSTNPSILNILPEREQERVSAEFFRIHQRVLERLAFDAGLPVKHSLLYSSGFPEVWHPFAKQQGYESDKGVVKGLGYLRKTFKPVNHVLSGREAKLLQLYREKLERAEPITEIKINLRKPDTTPVEIKITKGGDIPPEHQLFSYGLSRENFGVYADTFVNAGYLHIERNAQHRDFAKAVKRALRGSVRAASKEMFELAAQGKLLNPKIPEGNRKRILSVIAPFIGASGAEFYVEKGGALVVRKLLTPLD